MRIESYSSLATLAACSEKYRLGYVEGLESFSTIAQHNGSAMHAAMRVLYSGGFSEANVPRAILALREEWGDVRPAFGDKKDFLTLGFAEARLETFVEERLRAPTWLEEAEVVMEFAEELHEFEWSVGGEVVRVRGVPDLVVKSNGEYFVVDHKFPTSGWLTDFHFIRYRLGHQLRMYAAMYRNLTGNIAQGAINAVWCGEKALDPPEAWKKRSSFPSRVKKIEFSREQIEETHAWIRGLEAQRETHYLTGLWPQNEMACDDWGGCEFRELCMERNPNVRAAKEMTNFKRKER